MKLQVIDEGTVVLLVPDEGARSWLEDNCGIEAWQWLGNSLGVEPRYVGDLLDGFISDGGEVS